MGLLKPFHAVCFQCSHCQVCTRPGASLKQLDALSYCVLPLQPLLGWYQQMPHAVLYKHRLIKARKGAQPGWALRRDHIGTYALCTWLSSLILLHLARCALRHVPHTAVSPTRSLGGLSAPCALPCGVHGLPTHSPEPLCLPCWGVRHASYSGCSGQLQVWGGRSKCGV